jgi:hypothetical protein
MLDEVERAGRLGSDKAIVTMQRIKNFIRVQIETIFEPDKLYMPRVEGIEWLDTGSVIPTCAGHGAKLGGESPLRAELRRFVSLGKGVHREMESEGS